MGFKFLLAFFLGVSTLAAQAPEFSRQGADRNGPSEPAAHPKPPPNPATAVKTEPKDEPVPGFDATAFDLNAEPCVDFYQYACGTWRANHPIPPDRSRWSRFDELQERNLAILRDVLQSASVNNPNRDPIEQKIGDYYAACMDEQAIDRKGITPIKPDLDRIAALADKKALAVEVARLHRIGANADFVFGQGTVCR